MRVYMTRHGQSLDNANKIVSGDRETPLTELGKHQSRQLGNQARELGIDLIVSSPLKRARQTASLIAETMGYPESSIKIMEELAERSLGALEGHSYARNELLNGNFPAVEHIKGVEPLSQMHGRIQHALREITGDKQHKSVLIVAHFIVGRMLRTIVDNRPARAIYEEPRLENATIYQLI